MTRIIAGRARGRRLGVPGTARPTTDRVRESLFAALEHRLDGFEGLHVLDLFAGSGALGLEAASRGAAAAVLVESDARAVEVIRRNAAAVDLPGIRVVRRSVEAYLSGEAQPFDLVLLDPPYQSSPAQVTDLLASLVNGWLADGALVVVERQAGMPMAWPAGLAPLADRTFGSTTLWYGRPVPPGDDR